MTCESQLKARMDRLHQCKLYQGEQLPFGSVENDITIHTQERCPTTCLFEKHYIHKTHVNHFVILIMLTEYGCVFYTSHVRTRLNKQRIYIYLLHMFNICI